MLRVSVRTGPNWAEGLEADWDALLHSSPSATPFQSREWITTWWEFFGKGRKPHVVLVHEGEQLVALFPMFKGRGLWSALRPMGVGPSDYHRILASKIPESPGKSEQEVLDHLQNQPGLVDLHQFQDLGIESINQATCLVVDLPDSYDTYVAGLSKSLRYDVRRIDKIPDVAIREDLPPEESLRILFDLHKQRWKSRGLPGAFLGKTVKFHEAWFKQAGNMAKISVLEWEGKPVGAIYTMHLSGTTYYYQAGFDPGASGISPGTLLVAHALKASIERGDKHFDFCRGDEPYKRRWKPTRVVTNYRVLIPGSGLGRVGEGWNRFAWSIEERIRRRLEGGSLLPKKGGSRKAESL